MRFPSTLFAALTLSVAAVVAPAEAHTLGDTLAKAYRNSALLDQNQALLRAADEDVATAVSALRPVIQFTADAGWSRVETSQGGIDVTVEGLSASIGIAAELVLLDFGRAEIGVEIAKEAVLATRQALIGVEQQVLLAAASAYVDVQLQAEIVALRQSNVRVITQEVRAARDRFEVGEATRTDLAIAEARLAGANANLAAAQGALMVARESYRAATGEYPDGLARLPRPPSLPRTQAEAERVALHTHPQLRQAQHEVRVAELNAELAAAQMKPTLAARAALSVNEDANSTASVGLQLNQTIYAGGRLSALYRRALAGEAAARAGLAQAGVQIAQNLGNAWAQLAVFHASIEASDRQIRAAQTAYDGVREEAELGARTTLDVLNAEQELLDARALRLEAEAGRYVAIYQVLAAMGLLTVEHLQLGIPTYDPEAYYDAVKSAPATSAQGRKLDRILGKIGADD